MNRQKLISVLQSRIAKRRNRLAQGWELLDELKHSENNHEAYYWVVTLVNVGVEQKQDKAILKQMYVDTNRQESYENTLYRMDNEIHKLHRQLASYKLTGMPYVGGNAN